MKPPHRCAFAKPRPSWCLILLPLLLAACSDEGSDDVDGDGFGAATDCDDGDPNIFPGADDTPLDGIDQDCDGEDSADGDGDGFIPGAGGGFDCDDTDATIHPDASETAYDGIDQDCDGLDLSDVDGDGHDAEAAGGDDCNDEEDRIHPGALDPCQDGSDQDCNGVDPVCSDLDMDMDGYSLAEGDCDEEDPLVHPGAEEVTCNGIDDDCDADTPDDDLDGDGFAECGTTCDDTDPSIYPGADEIPYDGIDQDCNGSDLVDLDSDGYDAIVAGGSDCNDRRDDVNPGITEIPYDNIDQNCDESDFIGTPTHLTMDVKADSSARVAHGAGKYLVTWTHVVDSLNRDVMGRFVGEDGAPVGSEFLIRRTPTIANIWIWDRTLSPRVASNGTNFLVTWREFEDGLNAQVYAQVLDSDGAPVGTAMALSIVVPQKNDVPAVASNGSDYIVAWRSLGLRARRIAADGTMGAERTVHNSANTAYRTPRIGSDGSSYLVSWRHQVNPSGARGVFGRLVDENAAPIRPLTNFSTLESVEVTDVGFDGTNYLVALVQGDDLLGQRVEDTGTPLGENFVISNAIGAQSDGAVSFTGGAYSVVFRDTRWSQVALYMQRVDTGGEPFGTTAGRNAPLVAAIDAPDAPGIASAGTSALVAWSMGGSIYVERISP